METKQFLSVVSETQKRKLSEQEIHILTTLADELESSNFNNAKQMLTDSWDVSVLYNGIKYEANYYINKSETFKNLINKLIKLSPIEVHLRELA